MPPGHGIRRLGHADAAAYKALRDTLLTAHPTAFTSDAGEEVSRTAESYYPRLGSLDGTTTTLGACHAAQLVGALTCERDARRKVRHIGHLTGMMVAAAAQGTGLGSALLAAAIDAARRAELTLLTLSVTAGNDGAIRLYERFGFHRVGRLPRAVMVDGTYHAKEQMALLL